MAQIFVSYKRHDKDIVFPIVEEIKQKTGVGCWIDLEGIESGDQFQNVIIDAIDNADIVIFMLSQNFIAPYRDEITGKIDLKKQTFPEKEVMYALRHNKRLIPISIDGTTVYDCKWVEFNCSGLDYIDWSNKTQRTKLLHNLSFWKSESLLQDNENKSDSGDENCPKFNTEHNGFHNISQLYSWINSHRFFATFPVFVVLFLFVAIYLHKENNAIGFNVNGVEFKLIKVPSGSFMLGAKDALYIDETPQTEVSVKSFYIGETEVTKALWYAIMIDENTGKSNNKELLYPIYNISYKDMCLFISRLNHKLKSQIGNSQFRLPTEIEWEYAAKSCTRDDDNIYCGSNNVNDVGWYEGNSSNNIHKVASKKPNKLGLYDMSGNVWECCSNAYFEYSNLNSLVLVQDVDTIMSCVRRGGSWKDAQNCLRTTFRSQQLLMERKNNVGFRLVLSE